MFVYKTGCSAGEQYSQRLFSKVLQGSSTLGRVGGQQARLGWKHRTSKDLDLVWYGGSMKKYKFPFVKKIFP